MKQYDSYKPSGVEWIGDIPSHWKVKRGKYLFDLISGFPADSSLFNYDHEGLPLVRIRDIFTRDTEVYYTGVYPKEAELKPDDILIGMDGDFNISKWKGNKAILNQRVCKVKQLNGISLDYLFYQLKTTLKVINDVTYATTVKHLSTNDLFRSAFSIPPLEEQEQIAEYLDERCAEIDGLIEKEEKAITLLDELKQSIITEAVTRGLDPTAPLKPSGVEWIGDIPSHWEVSRLKNTVDFEGGLFEDGDWIETKNISTNGIRYLTSGNVGVIQYKEQGNGYISENTFKSLCCKEVFEGDILISRLNEPISRACIVPNLSSRIVTCVDNVIYRPNLLQYNKKYIVYSLNSEPYTNYVNLIARGVTMSRITRTSLGKQYIPVPPLEEQEQIAEYLDERCGEIEAAKAKKLRQIELLRELKQTLISDAVTGRIKVI